MLLWNRCHWPKNWCSTWNTPQSRYWRRAPGAPVSSPKLSVVITCNGNCSASSATVRTALPPILICASPLRLRCTPTGVPTPTPTAPASATGGGDSSTVVPNTVQLADSWLISDLTLLPRKERAIPSRCIDSSTLVFPLPLQPKNTFTPFKPCNLTCNRFLTLLICNWVSATTTGEYRA